jgi:hypothetical protein
MIKSKYAYRWTHPDSSSTGIRAVECDSRLLFLELLNKWNCSARGKWVYWEVGGEWLVE